MNELPFNLEGIYAREVDLDKNLSNYLHNIGNALFGKKPKRYYEVLYIKENIDHTNEDNSERKYCVDYFQILEGELLSTLKWCRTRSCGYVDYKGFETEGNQIYFHNERIECKGWFYDKRELSLLVKYKDDGEEERSILKFITWL